MGADWFLLYREFRYHSATRSGGHKKRKVFHKKQQPSGRHPREYRMSTKLAHFEWLLSDRDDTEPPTDGPADAEILPPCPGGQTRMEQISILGDIDLYLFNGRFDEALTLHAIDERPGRQLGMILTQAGNYRFQPAGCGQPYGIAQDTVILHVPEEREAHYFFSAGERVDLVALTINHQALHDFLAADRPPALLRGLMEGRMEEVPPLLDRMALSPAFAGVTRQLLNNPYHGPARRLFFESKVLESLAELLHRLHDGNAASRPPALSSWERFRVFEARDVLVSRIADPPSLPELARLVNLPAKRLNRLFREVFGTTPFAWVLDYRLTLAKQLLTEESLPIKQVAHRLGYANVHNFTHAFTARFGMPPGALRGRGKKTQ
jgi:AraC-like DNA-binding protein